MQAFGRGVLISSCRQVQIISLLAEQRQFNSQAKGQNPFRQAIMYGYNNSNNKKQAKETVPTGVRVRIGSSLQTPYLLTFFFFFFWPVKCLLPSQTAR